MSTPLVSNREIGLIWMGDVLPRLYDKWPARTNVKLADTLEATKIVPQGGGEYTGSLWRDLWLWLEEEKLVRLRPEDVHKNADVIRNVVLTSKGFGALQKAAPGSSESFGDKLSELAMETGKGILVESGKTAVAETMGAFFGSLFRSAAS